MGPRRTRICVKLDYYPAQSGLPAATRNAHVSADLTRFMRFVESDAARQAAHELSAG